MGCRACTGRRSAVCLIGWHRSPTMRTPCSWTCGTGRHQVSRSLPTCSDRPTVRAGFRTGQTAARLPSASLWMKPCRGRGRLVTFAVTELPRHRRNTSITIRCDLPNTGFHTPADLRKQ
jgi:hypothetical protein